ncbi:MAG: hypothetical protein GTO63_23545, partial [Anaerolineae bacterium]|nr:hypothetical protein [Anaerolineae bacterium]
KYELPVLARLYLADSRPDQALEVLEQITHMAEEARRPHLQVEAEILRARAFHHLGRPAESDEALTRALKLAAPERSMRLFL